MARYPFSNYRNSLPFSVVLLLLFPRYGPGNWRRKDVYPTTMIFLETSPCRTSREIPFSLVRNTLLFALITYTLHPPFLTWKLHTWSNCKWRLSGRIGVSGEYVQRTPSRDLKIGEPLLGGVLLDWLWWALREAEGREKTQSEIRHLWKLRIKQRRLFEY